jgi:glycosyltransferase involved in cell wall biosynthesis
MNAQFLVNVAFVFLSAPVLASSAYLFALAALSRRRPNGASSEPRLRFEVIVPAHNEERNIFATVSSLAAVDYPPALRRIVVVADNCEDATADQARAAGATVLVRNDASKRGKGYALSLAFEQAVRDKSSDAVVVVDADTEVSPNLLRAFAARFDAGAPAVQARYGVRNRRASWRTRLMAIALAAFHDVRSIARERLALSCGLRGNGMAFRTSLLADVPHDAYSIVEDVEYGIKLGRLGHRVWYVDEASVLGDMEASGRTSRSQRQRWEGGRKKLAREQARALLADAVRRRDRLLLDLALDLLVPPLSSLALASTGGAFLSGCFVALGWATAIAVVPWAASLAFILAYISRGVMLSGAGLRGFVDLAFAPAYVAWKIVLALRPRPNNDAWVRTARAGEKVR